MAASQKLGNLPLLKVPPPRILKEHLDDYVIGQDIGKKVLSVAVYNHYLRINDKHRKLQLQRKREMLNREQEQKKDDENEPIVASSSESQAGLKNLQSQFEFDLSKVDEDLELSKSNVLIVGPSGTGKTLLATTLAKVLDVPIAITDCTQMTQAGYIGEDVQVCIERLLINADYDVAKAERGIIVLDEIDKLAKPAASIGTKDVSGEGVQQSLLKILEGHKVELTVKRPVKISKDNNNNQATSKKDESFTVDTSNILFMIMGAFIGLDKHVKARITKLQDNSKSSGKSSEIDNSQNLRFSNKVEEIELQNGKKTCALNLVTPSDLVTFGLIPELIGRVPIITALEPLQKDDLYHILRKPKNALLDQYEYIFQQFGVRLAITRNGLDHIARLALAEGTGARGLRGIMERLLLNINYQCPESGVSYVLINEKTVESLQQTKYSLATNVDAKYYSEEQKDKFLHDVYTEDELLGVQLKKELAGNAISEKSY